MTMQNAAVGLDLGTTISVASYVDASGSIHLVKDRKSNVFIPSALFFGDHVIVGHDATDLVNRSSIALRRDSRETLGSRIIRNACV